MAMYQVRVADLLYASAETEEEKQLSARRFYRVSLLSLHVFDVLCGFTLVAASCDWRNFRSCVVGSLFKHEGYEMKHGSAVCLMLALTRCLIFPLFSVIAVYFGVESAHFTDANHKSQNDEKDEEDELKEKLLAHAAEVEEGYQQNARNKAKQRARVIKYFFLGSIFAVSCGYQIYSGIKVSNYKWHHEKTTEILMICLSVLWINLQAYLYRSLIEDYTTEEGLYLKHVHKHPLFWTTGVYMHDCDLCNEKIRNKVGGCFRCRLCDYDVCVKCAQRTDIGDVGEDLIRSDKGVKMETTVSGTSYLTRAADLARPQWPLLSISFSCLVLNCFTNLALPHVQGKIINDLIQGDKDTFKSHIGNYLTVLMIQGLFNGCSSFLFSLVFRKLTFFVRNKLFASVLKQDVAFFDGTTSGNLTSKLTNDVLWMMNPIRNSLTTLLSNSILLIGGIAMCYYNSYKLSLLAFVTVGPIMFLWDLYGQYSKKLNRKMLSAWGTANSSATEALNHVRDVKIFCNEDEEIKQYEAANNVALQAGIKDSIGNGVAQMLTGYLDLGTGVLILWFGGFLVLDGAITVGELVAFQFYWNMMNNAYQGLQGLLVQFTQAAAAAEKVFSLWDNKPDIDDEGAKEIDWPVEGGLSLKNVSFYYQMRPDNIVLSDVSIKIEPGQVCAFVGRSGGGKSTLIRLFLRFYDPKTGTVMLDGRDYATLKVSDLRKNFGCVAQSTTLFAKSILYNITYGLDPTTYTMEDVITACKKAQCYDFIMSFKDQFETRCGEAGVRISGGQAQRVAIARVFLRKPKIVLLDEATSALDEESQKLVQDALNTLLQEKGSTVILVAHRLSTVRSADKIAVIDKGVVLEEGSHDELMERDDGIYKKLVNLKLEKEQTLLNGDKDKDGKNNAEAEGVEAMMEEVMKKREEAKKAKESENTADENKTSANKDK